MCQKKQEVRIFEMRTHICARFLIFFCIFFFSTSFVFAQSEQSVCFDDETRGALWDAMIKNFEQIPDSDKKASQAAEIASFLVQKNENEAALQFLSFFSDDEQKAVFYVQNIPFLLQNHEETPALEFLEKASEVPDAPVLLLGLAQNLLHVFVEVVPVLSAQILEFTVQRDKKG